MTKHGTTFRPLFILFLLLPFFLLPNALFAAADTETTDDKQCYPSCYDTPEPPQSGGSGGGAWGGYSDGRVAPDMAEYYSIYCANDQIMVWGGSPSPQLIQSIPIVRVLQTDPNGGSFDAGAGLTVARPNPTIVIITGTNGNGAPAQGSKIFGIQECIDRNGGAPAIPATAVPTTAPAAPRPTSSAPTSATPPCSFIDGDPGCSQLMRDWCGAINFEYWACQPYLPSNNPQNAIVASVQFCLSAFMMVGFVPAFHVLRRKRKQ